MPKIGSNIQLPTTTTDTSPPAHPLHCTPRPAAGQGGGARQQHHGHYRHVPVGRGHMGHGAYGPGLGAGRGFAPLPAAYAIAPLPAYDPCLSLIITTTTTLPSSTAHAVRLPIPPRDPLLTAPSPSSGLAQPHRQSKCSKADGSLHLAGMQERVGRAASAHAGMDRPWPAGVCFLHTLSCSAAGSAVAAAVALFRRCGRCKQRRTTYYVSGGNPLATPFPCASPMVRASRRAAPTLNTALLALAVERGAGPQPASLLSPHASRM